MSRCADSGESPTSSSSGPRSVPASGCWKPCCASAWTHAARSPGTAAGSSPTVSLPPFVPGPTKVFTAWLPAPSGSLDLGQAGAAMTFTHLVWTAMAGLGAGLLWRTRGWWRLLSLLPVAVAITHHTLNNYTASKPGGPAENWLENLDSKAWVMPLVCLALAMVVDLRHLHRAKHTVPGILLATEHPEGDSVAALIRYASWRPPFSTLIALRFVRLRRSLMYAAALTPPEDTELLRRVVATVAAHINASDHEDAWRTVDVRAHLKAARPTTRRRWLLLIPCLLALPSVLFLGVGSFKSTSHLQESFTTGPGPRVLLWCGVGALAWIAWQLLMLLRTLRAVSAQLVGEVLAVHRFRLAIAVGSAAAGGLLLYRGLGDAGPSGDAIRTFHLLEALDTFLVYLGFALLLLSLLSLLTLFPPGAGLVLAGGGMLAEGATAAAALAAGNLGVAGTVLMAVGAEGASADGVQGSSDARSSDSSATEPASGQSNRVRPPREGDTDYVVDNPADWADTITDIDRIEDGVLWEEKTATGRVSGMNFDNWVGKHVFKKLDSYVRARPHMQGYENAPIGIRFTEPGATPEFKAAVESGVKKWLQGNPGVDVRVWWAQ